MKQKELTKTLIMILNRKNSMVSIVYTKIIHLERRSGSNIQVFHPLIDCLSSLVFFLFFPAPCHVGPYTVDVTVVGFEGKMKSVKSQLRKTRVLFLFL